MSYRTIVSVVNDHTVSLVTARYAISLAASCPARLVLYAAHDEGTDEGILQRSAHHLDHLYEIASAAGISVARISDVGDLGTLLPKRMQAEQADLLLYPLTSDRHHNADLQRNTVHHLQRTIRSDLAIMRAATMAKPHPRHILVPLGKTISNQPQRLQFISQLARSFQAQVTLFHLTRAGDTQGMPDDITRFRKELQQQKVTVLERSGSGAIGRSITVEAITHHNDLIILGASERGLLQRLFFGNPTGDVMHQPPCNTILFRAAPKLP